MLRIGRELASNRIGLFPPIQIYRCDICIMQFISPACCATIALNFRLISDGIHLAMHAAFLREYCWERVTALLERGAPNHHLHIAIYSYCYLG
jgi:hypothetical protein